MCDEEGKDSNDENWNHVELNRRVVSKHQKRDESANSGDGKFSKEQNEITDAVDGRDGNDVGPNCFPSNTCGGAEVDGLNRDDSVSVVIQVADELLETVEATNAALETTVSAFVSFRRHCLHFRVHVSQNKSGNFEDRDEKRPFGD